MMDETQRQYCLEQMGIQTWFPRYRLSAAAPSVLRLIPAVAEPVSSDTAVSETGIQPAETDNQTRSGRADATLRQLEGGQPGGAGIAGASTSANVETDPDTTTKVSVDKMSAAPEGVARPGSTVRSDSAENKVAAKQEGSSVGTGRTETAPADSSMVRCKLALSVLPGKILVLNQLPAAGNGQLPVPHQQLLGRISQFLNKDGGETQIQSIHPFRWPLLDLPDVDNGITALRSALMAFIEGHADSRISALILMGSLLTEDIFPSDEEAQGQLRQGPGNLSCPVVGTYSLDQLIKMPELKRECWLALRHLSHV